LSHDALWAPWLSTYVLGKPTDDAPRSEPTFLPGADPKCFLCVGAATPADDRRNLVAWRGAKTLVVLNRYPYNAGHVLVAPLVHRPSLDDLDDAVHLEAMRTLGRLTSVIETKMNAAGFNVGLNLGKVAGAGVPGHLHWHLVPRWDGDQNFMPVTADTRVLSQSLDALWELLHNELSGD
jgi:ATP adenylyltransferase